MLKPTPRTVDGVQLQFDTHAANKAAYHEAGHIIVGCHYGFDLCRVVKHDQPEENSYGKPQVDWLICDLPKPTQRRRCATMAVAGCVAECLFYKISPIRWRWDISVDPDQQQVREHFPPAEDENLFWEAKKILMVNWTLLLRTAAFLRLRQFTLSGEEILEFLAKENFPYEIEFLGTRDIDLLGNQA